MTRYEWVTIIAIVVGPMLALFAQRVLDSLRDKQKRRENLFFTLLTTRASPLMPAHVQALNSIDVVYGEPGDQAVRDAWARVRDQMNLDAAGQGWYDRLMDLKCDLLQSMGGRVGFEFSVDYLKRQGYLPRHYTDMEQDQLIIRQRMAKAMTDNGIKVIVTEYVQQPKPQKDSS